MTSGIIFDIKRFALHDGPGLRTTVFLKGCPLSCLGCHNPEGQAMEPELLFRPDRCTECRDCLDVCPRDALSWTTEARGQGPGLQIDRERCQMSRACVEVCLPGALEVAGVRRTSDEVLEVLESDRLYFDESGGGVTFSGGEPFSQPDFLRELLVGCRNRELGTVVDTCGHVPPEVFREVAVLADALLVDLKLIDEARHRAFTGVSNTWILENLRWLGEPAEGREEGGVEGGRAERGKGGRREGPRTGRPAVTVRIPLLPGVNDDEENLRASASFLANRSVPFPVDLLPYHRLGEGKYPRVGRTYRLSETRPPSQEAVGRAVALFERAGLGVTVKGERYGHD